MTRGHATHGGCHIFDASGGHVPQKIEREVDDLGCHPPQPRTRCLSRPQVRQHGAEGVTDGLRHLGRDEQP
jgi:hypothetical protein